MNEEDGEEEEEDEEDDQNGEDEDQMTDAFPKHIPGGKKKSIKDIADDESDISDDDTASVFGKKGVPVEKCVFCSYNGRES